MVTPPHERAPAEMASPTARAPRVLVVDNDQVIRRLIAANLMLEGFDVAMAADEHECLDHVSAMAPDVITLDVTTSGPDGWQTAIRLRENPGTAHIKLVLITGRAEDFDRTRDTYLRADALVAKPFDVGALIHAIRTLTG
jgi:CheY-like chemotaxis protein